MKIKHIYVAIAAILFLAACNWQQCDGGSTCVSDTSNGPSPLAVPSISPSPSPSPTATPVDPCAAPVTGVHLSGPTSVSNGSVFKVDVTPVSASGPLEGDLDYCNQKGRVVTIESMSVNLRCAGQCSGFGPQFVAQGVGPFSIKFRIDNAYGDFHGTVLK